MVTRTYEILTQPDLAIEYQQLVADQRAQMLIASRSTDVGIRDRAQERVDELTAEKENLEERIVAAARTITVGRVAPKVWARIVAENPPRPDDPYDARMAFNTDTFDRALMPHAIETVVDGHGEPADWDWPSLTEAMSPGQYELIIGETLRMHMERDAVPFSLADWRDRHPSEQS